MSDLRPMVVMVCGPCIAGIYVTGGAFPDAASDALTHGVGVDVGIVPTNDGDDGYNRILAGYDKAIATERERRTTT